MYTPPLIAGPQGAPGSQGIQGIQGTQGTQGIPGGPGAAGTPYAREYKIAGLAGIPNAASASHDTAWDTAVAQIAANGGYGTIVIEGNLKFTTQKVHGRGVNIKGIFGAPASRIPEIYWFGPDNVDAIVYANIDAPGAPITRQNWLHFENFILRCPNAPTTRFKDGIVFENRVDTCVFDHFAVQHGKGYPINFKKGTLNVFFHGGWRTDHNDNPIRVAVDSVDNISFDEVTYDNQIATPDSNSGWLEIDASGPQTQWVYTRIHSKKLEVNSNMAAGSAVITFKTNPDQAARHQYRVELDTQVYQAGGVTEFTMLKVDPPTDFIDVSIRGGKGKIAGIPAWEQRADPHLDYWMPGVEIHPDLPSYAAGNAAYRSFMQWLAEFNLVGELKQTGKPVALTRLATTVPTDWLKPQVIKAGDTFIDPAQLTSGATSITTRRAKTPGTMGVLTGVTATATGNVAVITVNTIAGLSIGYWLTVNARSLQIRDIHPVTRVVSLSGAVGNAFTNLPVTFTAPTWLDNDGITGGGGGGVLPEGYAVRPGWFVGPPIGHVSTTAQIGQGIARAHPIYYKKAGTVDQFVAEVATAGEPGSLLRIVAYREDTLGGYPAAVIVQGTVVADSIGLKTLATGFTVAAGETIYVEAIPQLCPVTAPFVRVINSHILSTNVMPTSQLMSGWQRTGITTTAPDPFPAGALAIGGAPRVFTRMA